MSDQKNIFKSYLRLVEEQNGDILLKGDDEQLQDPMLVLRFSEDALEMMQGFHMDIAGAMVKAGIIAFQNLSESTSSRDKPQPGKPEPQPPTEILEDPENSQNLNTVH